MKRSRSVTLLTMASATLALSACEEKSDLEGEVYRNTTDCEQSEFVPDSDCAPLMTEGERIHVASAPRYSTLQLCESKHGTGECLGGTGKDEKFYSPSPVGYMVTGAIAGAAISNLVRPVYRERGTRRYYTTGGGYINYMNNGRYNTQPSTFTSYNPTVKQAPPRVQTRTTVASRSGFGSRSGSFSFGG